MGLVNGIGLFVSHNAVLSVSFVVIVAGFFGLVSYLKG